MRQERDSQGFKLLFQGKRAGGGGGRERVDGVQVCIGATNSSGRFRT